MGHGTGQAGCEHGKNDSVIYTSTRNNLRISLPLPPGGCRKSLFEPQRTQSAQRKAPANALRSPCPLWFKLHRLAADVTAFATPSPGEGGGEGEIQKLGLCRVAVYLSLSRGAPSRKPTTGNWKPEADDRNQSPVAGSVVGVMEEPQHCLLIHRLRRFSQIKNETIRENLRKMSGTFFVRVHSPYQAILSFTWFRELNEPFIEQSLHRTTG